MSFTRNLIFSITLTTSAAFCFGQDYNNFSWSDFTYNSPEEKAFWDNVPDWTDTIFSDILWAHEWFDSNGSEVDENSSDLYTGYSKIIKYSAWFMSFSGEDLVSSPIEEDLRIIAYLKNGRILKQSCWDVNGTKLFSESRNKGTDNIFVINKWYQNGVMASHIVTDIEKPNLISFNSWLPNGQRCSKTNLQKGSGPVVYYYADGQKESEENYKNGKRDGLLSRWHENGQKSSEGNCKNGRRDGLWTEWYENGQKKREVNYKDGKQDGLATWWNKDGQKSSEGNYKDGKRDGLLSRWHENGQKSSEGNYKNGRPDGLWTEWQEDGNLTRKTKYKDETRTVTHYWVSTGKKKQEDTYKNNKHNTRDGLLTKWFENGQKELEENYKGGLRFGVFKKWDENGTLIRTGINHSYPPRPIRNQSTPNRLRIPPPRR